MLENTFIVALAVVFVVIIILAKTTANATIKVFSNISFMLLVLDWVLFND